MRNFKPTLIALAVASTLGGAGGTHAAGFALIEQDGSGLGRAYAGSAAIADDASTVFFNPAGLTYLQGAQVVVAASAIGLQAKFTDNGLSSIPAGVSVPSPPAPLPPRPKGGNGGDAGDWAYVPNLYVAAPIGERWRVGLGINAPFGLKTEYDDNWMGRFQGIKSEIKTMNVNPSVAYRVTDRFSLGAGVSWQKIDAELTSAVVLGLNTEGRTKLEADDDAWGWNVGAVFDVSQDMRIGLTYRSQISYTLSGDITTTTLGGTVVAAGSGPAQADLKLPDSATLSVFQRFNDKWDFMGDISWTHWSTIKQINVTSATTGALRDQLNLQFDDAWRVAFGAQYHHGDRWIFKGGLAWDQTPVQDAFRTVRLPDNDRYWLALGAQYRFNQRVALDVGYAHLFLPDGSIDFTRSQLGAAGTSSRVAGDYKSSVDIISAQLTVSF
jgi:long-chain fatty acid transport protein